MSTNLGEVGGMDVTRFCGPVGRRESYQLTGSNGYVTFTWEEFLEILEVIKTAREVRE